MVVPGGALFGSVPVTRSTTFQTSRKIAVARMPAVPARISLIRGLAITPFLDVLWL